MAPATLDLATLKKSQPLKTALCKLLEEKLYTHHKLEITQIQDINGFENMLCAEIQATDKNKKNKIKERKFLLKLSGKNDYPMEMYAYEKLLPALDKFQEEKKFTYLLNIPKCYGKFDVDENEVVVVDGPNGEWTLKNASKAKEFKGSTIRTMLFEYAKLHALALGMKIYQADLYNSLVKPLNKDYDKFQDGKVEERTKKFRDVLQEIMDVQSGGKQENSDANKKFYKVLFKKVADSMKCMVDNSCKYPFKILCQGDFWANEFQFYYRDDDDNRRGTIVGWKRPYETCPIYDIAYFVFVAADPAKMHKAFEYFKFYQERFESFLVDLKIDKSKYTLEKMSPMFDKYSRLGLLQAFNVVKRCSDGDDKKETKEYTQRECFKARAEALSVIAVESKLMEVDMTKEDIEKLTGVKIPGEEELKKRARENARRRR